MERVLAAWGVDGHNSHTNICSSSGALRATPSGWASTVPVADHANADVILLISAHLESGHYFNPHAQRIIEGKARGAKLIVFDSALSNTATQADHWLAPLAGQRRPRSCWRSRSHLIQTRRYDREFVRRWWNWRSTCGTSIRQRRATFERFEDDAEVASTRDYTFEFAASESGVPAAQCSRGRARSSRARARGSRRTTGAPPRPATSAAGRSRAACSCSNALLGAVGDRRRRLSERLEQVRAASRSTCRRIPKTWNELHWPDEYPLAHARDDVPAAAFPRRRAAASSTSTSRASTTRSGPTPTASRGSRC